MDETGTCFRGSWIIASLAMTERDRRRPHRVIVSEAKQSSVTPEVSLFHPSSGGKTRNKAI